MSDPVIIGLAIIVMIVLITLGAILKYKEVGSVLQIWAMMGTLIGFATGTMGTYFFTKEKAQQYQTAFQASEREKAEASEQLLKVAAKIKPDVSSPEAQALLEATESAARFLAREVPVSTTSPSPLPSRSP